MRFRMADQLDLFTSVPVLQEGFLYQPEINSPDGESALLAAPHELRTGSA